MELEKNIIIEAFVHFRYDIVVIISGGMPLTWLVAEGNLSEGGSWVAGSRKVVYYYYSILYVSFKFEKRNGNGV